MQRERKAGGKNRGRAEGEKPAQKTEECHTTLEENQERLCQDPKRNKLHAIGAYFADCYWRSSKIKREMSLGLVTKGSLMLLTVAVSVK